MVWKINNFEFNADTRVLRSPVGETVLEPKISDLLNYFCLHPQRNITRDELFTEVWHGQLVTENAVNRVIALLRKALLDEDKVKKYIVTVPKIGYRFIVTPVITSEQNVSAAINQDNETIASVIKSNNLVANSNQAEQNDISQPSKFGKTANRRVLVQLLMFLVLLAFAYFISLNYSSNENNNPRVSPLTRLSSDQFDAAMANNGKQLIYSSYQNKEQALYLMTLPNGTPEKISLSGGRASSGQWASDDSRLVYLYRNNETCEFHQVDFISGKAQPPRAIYQCVKNSPTDFAFSKDNQTLYFVERNNEFKPFVAFQLNIATGEKTQLVQPTAIGKGNHHIDIDPITNKLLILSDQVSGKTSFYSLELSNNQLKDLMSFDYYIDNAAWSHKKNAIVHQGPHPAYQLLQTDLYNKQSSVLVSDTRRINDVKRINNHSDYLFSSYLFNSDIDTNLTITTDFNSSVTDFLPAISHDQTQLAFISKRSGYSKIWIKNVASDELTSIEPPDNGRSFYSLHWSADDQKLLVNTSKGLVIFEVNSGQTSKVLNLILPAYGASWFDTNELVYSQYIDNRWQLYRYNLTTNATTALHEKWAFALGNFKQKVFINQNFNVFLNGETELQFLSCQNPIFRHGLTMRLDDEDFYCISADNSSELLRLASMSTLHRQAHKMRSMGYYDYAVSGDQQALSKTKSASSDIMRTNF